MTDRAEAERVARDWYTDMDRWLIENEHRAGEVEWKVESIRKLTDLVLTQRQAGRDEGCDCANAVQRLADGAITWKLAYQKVAEFLRAIRTPPSSPRTETTMSDKASMNRARALIYFVNSNSDEEAVRVVAESLCEMRGMGRDDGLAIAARCLPPEAYEKYKRAFDRAQSKGGAKP